MTRAVREMTRSAGAHLRILVAELHDLGHRRVPLRKPVRDVVHVVGLRPGDRQRAAGRRRPHPAAFEAGRRHDLFRHRERPIRLVRRRRDGGQEREREHADDVLHDTSQLAFVQALTGIPPDRLTGRDAFMAPSIVKWVASMIPCSRHLTIVIRFLDARATAAAVNTIAETRSAEAISSWAASRRDRSIRYGFAGASMTLTCAATMRQPCGNRTQVCIVRPTLPDCGRRDSVDTVAKSLP